MKNSVRTWLLRVPALFYGLLWSGGVISYVLWGAPPDHVTWTAPAFLWTAAVLVLMAVSQKEQFVLCLCALGGFLVEVAGVHSGFPFGSYSYTQVLFPRVAGTPLVMGAAWIILLAYCRHLNPVHSGNRLTVAAAGAAWMVAIDLIIDPLAAGPLNYWTWNHPHGYYGVPWSNFGGWWVTAFVLLLVYPAPHTQVRPVMRVGLSTILFFTILALVYRLWMPAAVGLLLSVIHLFLQWRRSLPLL